MSANVAIVYHFPCLDGEAAAASLRLNSDATISWYYFPYDHKNAAACFKRFTDASYEILFDRIFLLDCFPAGYEDLGETILGRTTVIDHHEGNEERITSVFSECECVIFDKAFCASELVVNNMRVPPVIERGMAQHRRAVKLIGDYDVFRDPFSPEAKAVRKYLMDALGNTTAYDESLDIERRFGVFEDLFMRLDSILEETIPKLTNDTRVEELVSSAVLTTFSKTGTAIWRIDLIRDDDWKHIPEAGFIVSGRDGTPVAFVNRPMEDGRTSISFRSHRDKSPGVALECAIALNGGGHGESASAIVESDLLPFL